MRSGPARAIQHFDIDEDGSMASRDQRRQAASARPGSADHDRAGPAGRPLLRRRDLLGTAVGMTAASLAALAAPAAAQTEGTTPGSAPGSSAPAAGGSSGGKEPTVSGADLDLVRFARSAELALVAVYEQAIDAGKLKTLAKDQADLFRGHHADHATRMVDFAQDQAPTAPNGALLASLSSRVRGAGDEAAAIAALQEIEDQAAATYLWALGTAEDWQLAALLATIAPVDAQHATSWSRLAAGDAEAWVGGQLDAALPVEASEEGRWDPAEFPVGAP